MNEIYINIMPEETRLALVDEIGQLRHILYERPQSASIVNHIYKGIVKNVLPGMSAAFLDIGIGQNVYLNLKKGKQSKEFGKLFVGQTMMVQVVKEEMLGKSARVSADVSLAGHYIVLLPYSKGLHISKKIVKEERRRDLAAMVQPHVDKGYGFIIRTAANSVGLDELERDIQYLLQTWEQLQKRYKVAKNGSEIYGDADFLFRAIRDYVNDDVSRIVVDHQGGYERLSDLLRLSSYGETVELVLHNGKEPIFSAHHIEEQVQDLLNSRVELPSGGFIQIDHTEALTVIDVNSGHYTGNERPHGEVAVRVNHEAAEMIARHIALRDIGGIILCDFIDMTKKDDQEALLKHLSSLVKGDSVKTVVCGMTKLGLVEMTRKRERQGIQSTLFDTCQSCGGTGRTVSAETVYLQILRHLRDLHRAHKLKNDVDVRVHPTVERYFTKSVKAELYKELQRQVVIEGDGNMNPEAYSIVAIQNH